MSLLHPSTLALLIINSRVFFVVDDYTYLVSDSKQIDYFGS